VFAIACAFLSNWQFSRNEERERQLALIAANYDATPSALGDLIGADGADPEDQWHPVEVRGEYLVDHTSSHATARTAAQPPSRCSCRSAPTPDGPHHRSRVARPGQ
jgi:cytochrome oxidase assembly protein ShyY1